MGLPPEPEVDFIYIELERRWSRKVDVNSSDNLNDRQRSMCGPRHRPSSPNCALRSRCSMYDVAAIYAAGGRAGGRAGATLTSIPSQSDRRLQPNSFSCGARPHSSRLRLGHRRTISWFSTTDSDGTGLGQGSWVLPAAGNSFVRSMPAC